MATTSLGSCYRNSRNRRISHLLAAIVANESNPPKWRLCAYIALLEVEGISLLSHDPPLKDVGAISLQEVINWEIVNLHTGNSGDQ